MPRKDFVDALRAVAEKRGLKFQALSHDWIIQISDPSTKRVCSIFGYTFDVNSAGAVEICKEKAATSLVLASHGIANIPHSVFLSPGNEFTAPYVKEKGNWADMRALIEKLGLPVVLKPLKGTGGFNVVKAKCWREVEGAVQHLFSAEYGLAICPYKEIVDEYRCIYLDGKVEFVYRKVRSHVVGDGTSTLAALVASAMCRGSGADAKAAAQAASELEPEKLASVPASGQEVPLQWKHNLGLGASLDVTVPPEKKSAVEEIAIGAARAVGVRFCSADVVEVKGEGLMIMEINGGVMMDSLIGQLGDAGKALAERVYESAVLLALGLSLEAGGDGRGKRLREGDPL
mmetsp:Transcript_89260/g.171165  ORF Transcript_89260/g.171165 Transcript_89260/m.171165 type:complete len:345 (+) Transcript_89260:102-1136(+)